MLIFFSVLGTYAVIFYAVNMFKDIGKKKINKILHYYIIIGCFFVILSMANMSKYHTLFCRIKLLHFVRFIPVNFYYSVMHQFKQIQMISLYSFSMRSTCSNI